MSITINGATNTLTAASGLTIAGNTAVTGTLSATGTTTSTVAATANAFIAAASGGGDLLRIVPNAAGNGVDLLARNSADTILEPLALYGETVKLYATGGALIGTISTTGLAVTGTLSATGLASFGTTTKLHAYEAGGGFNYFTNASNGVGNGIAVDATSSYIVVGGSGVAVASSTALTLGTGVQLNLGATGQIKFPATQNASADANTLDDYEEGTWTAALTGSTADPTTPVTVTGKYTKIGRKVFVEAAFEAVDLTGATGFLQVTGLPFATSASMNSVAPATVTGHGATAPVTYVPLGSSVLRFIESTTDTYINVTAAAGKTVRTAVTYHV